MLLLHSECKQVELHIVFVHVGDSSEDKSSTLTNHAHVRLEIGALALANGDDDFVGQATPCQFAKKRLCFGNIRRNMGCTEVLRLFTLEFNGVKCNDITSTSEVCALHSIHANATGSDDNHGVTRSDLCGIGGRTPTGGYATGDKAGLIERKILFDFHERVDIHDGVFCEGAETAHGCKIGPVEEMMTRGSVLLATREKMRAVVAKVLLTLGT